MVSETFKSDLYNRRKLILGNRSVNWLRLMQSISLICNNRLVVLLIVYSGCYAAGKDISLLSLPQIFRSGVLFQHTGSYKLWLGLTFLLAMIFERLSIALAIGFSANLQDYYPIKFYY